jgi:DNA-binding MarR family transcriptional regulator
MNASNLPSLACMCGSIRRTSRALTQLYEQTLRPLGLRATQFTILQVLARAGEVSQGQLGEILAMDSTSLTRTLKIMIQQSWVAERPGRDRRERWLRLSRTGEAQMKRALPAWDKIQSRLRREMGEPAFDKLIREANRLTAIALNQGESL